jgi:hypothetical protein
MFWTVALIFGFILLLSLLREIKRLDFIWNRFPIFMQFIPTWSFFAPLPNMFDYHLLYREISNNGKVQEWKEVYSLEDQRPIYCLIWNPEKRFSKAFLDLAMDLIRFSEKVQDNKQVCTSLPYLQILNYLDSLCRKQSNFCQKLSKIQFLILTNSRIYDYDILFLSEIHPLSNG